MSRVIADRTKENSTTTGTGALDLDGAVAGFQGFVAAVGDGAVVYYTIAQQDPDSNNEWETVIGTVTSGSPDMLSRDTVISSSNAGSLVNFSAGTKDVFISVPHTGGPLVLDSASVSSVSEVDFDLPAGFLSYTIRGWVNPLVSDTSFALRFSNDGGATFKSGASDYAWATERVFTNDGFALNNDDDDMDLTGTTVASGNGAGLGINIEGAQESGIETLVNWRLSRRVNNQGFEMGGGSVLADEVNDAVRLMPTGAVDFDGELRLIGIP